VKPKFTTGQHLIHYGKEVEIVEVIEDTFGSMNEYKLHDLKTGDEYVVYENTLAVKPPERPQVEISSPTPAPTPKVSPEPQISRPRPLPIAREITEDSLPEEAPKDLLDQFKRAGQPKTTKSIMSRYENKVQSAFRTGKLSDLLDILEDTVDD